MSTATITPPSNAIRLSESRKRPPFEKHAKRSQAKRASLEEEKKDGAGEREGEGGGREGGVNTR